MTEYERLAQIVASKESFSIMVNNSPRLSCREHAIVTPMKVKVYGYEEVQVCPDCYEKGFPECADGIPDPTGVELKKQLYLPNSIVPNRSSDYLCSKDDCDNSTTCHSSCIICHAYFCKDHLRDGFVCDDCIAGGEDGAIWN